MSRGCGFDSRHSMQASFKAVGLVLRLGLVSTSGISIGHCTSLSILLSQSHFLFRCVLLCLGCVHFASFNCYLIFHYFIPNGIIFSCYNSVAFESRPLLCLRLQLLLLTPSLLFKFMFQFLCLTLSI